MLLNGRGNMKLNELQFHIGYTEESIYLVVDFDGIDSFESLADKYCLCAWESIGGPGYGHMMLDDNGSPFESLADAIETLVSDFSLAIEEGDTCESQLKSQVIVYSGGVPREIFNEGD